MKKFKYLKISKTKKLRFIDNYYKKNLYIVFLPGFMSDIDGEKPQAFKKYAVKNKLGFLAIEYSGHGKSSGKFTKGNITKWSNDAKNSIKKIIKKNKFILVGSSMGAWISLNQFKYFENQIVGFVGIGSAPEFLERLMWKKFPKKNKKQIWVALLTSHDVPLKLVSQTPSGSPVWGLILCAVHNLTLTANQKLLFVVSFITFMNWGTRLTYNLLTSF